MREGERERGIQSIGVKESKGGKKNVREGEVETDEYSEWMWERNRKREGRLLVPVTLK